MLFSQHPPHVARDLDTAEHPQLRPQLLDDWTARSWDAGVQIGQIEDLDILRAYTRNSSYELAVAAGCQGEMLVRGGRYFPEWTPVHFLGCSLGSALLKRHTVHVGMRMEFYWSGRRIVTSPVVAIRRDVMTRPAVPC